MPDFDSYKRIEIEITSKCNARCPGCSRTVKGETHPRLNVADFSYENFIKYVPAKALKNKYLEFCGVFGDTIMHKDVYKIFEYCKTAGASHITLDTNGGVKSKEWWGKLAQLGVGVTFSVDGHRETNHLYRVNTKFSKILENMKAFSKAGGTGCWEYIVFDHNESEIEIAREEAKKLGFEFVLRRSSRNTESWTSYIKRKENGKTVIKKFTVSQTNKKYQHSKENEVIKSSDDHIQINEKLTKKEIKCLLYNDKKLFLSFDGKLWPCCYFNDIYKSKGTINNEDHIYEMKSFDKLKELDKKFGLNWNSVLHHSWEEILNHEYYTSILPGTFNENSDKFQSEFVVPKCMSKCGNTGKLRDTEYISVNKDGTVPSDWVSTSKQFGWNPSDN